MNARGLMVALVACGGDPSERAASTADPIQLERARRGALVDRVLLTGALQPPKRAELRVPRTEANPLTIRWMAPDGAVLKAGDRALEFDTAQVARALTGQRTQVREAVAQLRTFDDLAAREIAQKEFDLEITRISRAKAELDASVPSDLVATRDAQTRQLAFARAQAEVERAEKELASERAENAIERRIKQVELERSKLAISQGEAALRALLLMAPRDGVIVVGEHPWMDRKFQVGDSAREGWSVLSQPEPGAGMNVSADLSDVDDGRVSVGMTGTCTLDAYPARPVPCTVTSMMPVAGARSTSSPRRSFAVVLALGVVDHETMKPGMSVKVELTRPPLPDAVLVPRGAVVFGADGRTRVRLGRGVSREVELGPCDAQRCAVTRGIAEGEQVSTGGDP